MLCAFHVSSYQLQAPEILGICDSVEELLDWPYVSRDLGVIASVWLHGVYHEMHGDLPHHRETLSYPVSASDACSALTHAEFCSPQIRGRQRDLLLWANLGHG